MKKFLAIFICLAVIFAFAACSKENRDEKVVTEVVTDENGETVTDEDGKAVTQIVEVTDENGDPVSTDKNGSSNGNASANGSASGSGSTGSNASGNNSGSGNSGSGNSGSGNSGSGNSGSNNNSGSNSGSNSENNNGSNGSEDKPSSNSGSETTKKPETTVAANRNIKISVSLPIDSSKEDTLTLYVNGEKVKEDKVVLNGTTYSFTTKDKYKGSVKVKASLKNYDKTTSTVTVTVAKNSDTAKINLMNIERLEGEND